MDTIKLKHFCAVVETGSLSKAAKLMGITHPGIHKSIKSLEFELDTELTTPEGRGITITPSGMALYEKMKELLNYEGELIQMAKNLHEEVYRFAMTDIFCHSLPGHIYENVTDLSFSFHERCPKELEEQVAAGKVHFGITTMPTSFPGVKHQEIFSLPFHLCALKKYELNNEIKFITPNSIFDTKQRDHWKEEEFRRRDVIKVNMLSMAMNLAKNGKGAVFIPGFVKDYFNKDIPKNKQLQIINLPKKLEVNVPVYYVTKLGFKLKDIDHKIIQTIKDHCLE